MALDLAQSQQLLVRIVEEGFAQRHSPLPGAYVKAQLLSRAIDQGTTFSERALGFKGFLEFVKTVNKSPFRGDQAAMFYWLQKRRAIFFPLLQNHSRA